MKRIMGVLVAMAVLSFAIPAFSQDKAGQKPEKEKEQAAEPEKKNEEKDPSKLFVDLSALMYIEWAYFSGFKYTGSNNATWGKVGRWGFIDDTLYQSRLITGIVPVQPYKYKVNENTFRMQRCY